MTSFYQKDSPYKKRARWAAISWTLLIFVLCFLPGREIPDVHIPLADKWVHFVLFGIFSFLWLCSYPGKTLLFSLFILGLSIGTGWLVEVIQGQLTFLGRSRENMDILADSIGGLLGVLVYHVFAFMRK